VLKMENWELATVMAIAEKYGKDIAAASTPH
jgi:hypothetical protein